MSPMLILFIANALFLLIMLGVWWVVKSFVAISPWLIIPWGAFFLFVAWRIDERDKRKRGQ